MKIRLALTFLASLALTACIHWPPPTRVDKAAAAGLYSGKCPLGIEALTKDKIFIDGKPIASFATSSPAHKEAADDAVEFVPKFAELLQRDYSALVRPGPATLTLHVRRVDLFEDDHDKHPMMTYETERAGEVVHGFMYEYPLSVGPKITGGAMAIYLGEYLKKVCAGESL